MSDVLLIHLDREISSEQRQRLGENFDQIHAATGLRPVVIDPGMAGEVQRDLSGLVSAIEDQTAAMRELAESNRAVVDLVIAQQQDEPETEARGPVARCLDDPPMEG